MENWGIDLNDFFDVTGNVKEREQGMIPVTVDEIKDFILGELRHREEKFITFVIEKDSCNHEFTLQKTKQMIILTKMNKPLKNFVLQLSYYDLLEDISTRLNTYINDLKYYI